MASENNSQHSLLLKAMIGLMSIIGALSTCIGVMTMSKIDQIQRDVAALIPTTTTHTTQLVYLNSDVLELKRDMKKAIDFRQCFMKMYGLKEDEIE